MKSQVAAILIIQFAQSIKIENTIERCT